MLFLVPLGPKDISGWNPLQANNPQSESDNVLHPGLLDETEWCDGPQSTNTF